MKLFIDSKLRCCVVVGLCAVLIISGCSLMHETFGAEQTVEPAAQIQTPPAPKEHPILTAARADKITMFGDFDGAAPNAYFTRTVVSLRQHSFTEVGGDADVTFDSTGRRMAFSSTRHNNNPDIYIKSVDGLAVTQLTSDPSSDVHPEFSPNDRRVAFASDRSGNWDIWVMDISGGQPVQITNTPSDEIHPSWSPDGRRLVYSSRPAQGGQWELWLSDAEAAGRRKFVGYGLFPEWAPQGETILYQRARERGSRMFSVWTMTLVDGEPRFPTEVAASATHAYTLPGWSKDGRYIAFTSIAAVDENGEPTDSKVSDIWMMEASGRGKVRVTDGFTANYGPAFAMDGRLFFSTSRSGFDNIWSVQAQTGTLAATIIDDPADGRKDAQPAMSGDSQPVNSQPIMLPDGL